MSLDRKILAVLYAANSVALPSKELTHPLGLSHTRLLDSIDALRKLGYTIDFHPQSGYRLLESPDMLIADDLMARLGKNPDSRRIGNQILVFKQTTSTNDIVQRLASEGHPEGLVVFAESQTASRGRRGRTWLSPASQGLWFTILLRPGFPVSWAQRLTMMTAVAVTLSLRKSTGLPLRIKWPNDILCHSRKVAGVLVELDTDGFHIRRAILGIGINVNMESSDFPQWLQTIATSLKQEAGKSFHRPSLAAKILLELDSCQSLLSDENFPKLLEQWIELDETLGQQIAVLSNDGKRLCGLASNVDSDGALIIRTDEGRLERVMAGDVTLEKEIS